MKRTEIITSLLRLGQGPVSELVEMETSDLKTLLDDLTDVSDMIPNQSWEDFVETLDEGDLD